MVDPAHPTVIDPLSGACIFSNETLPEELPSEPLSTLQAWMTEAASKGVQPNPNAMTLSTIDADGWPSARIVLCRKIDLERGFCVFYTNEQSRKGRAILANPRVAATFHWDHLDRQVRIEGLATQSPAQESDAYFRSRPVLSRVAAWASNQSAPLESRELLLRQNEQAEARFGVAGRRAELESLSRAASAGFDVPRPAHWGGFRIWISRCELWRGHSARLHDRAVWTRTLTPARIDDADGFVASAWTSTRLQP